MAEIPEMNWFLAPPELSIPGYVDEIKNPMCMQTIARKLFRGRYRKSKTSGETPRTPAGANNGGTFVCDVCGQHLGSKKLLVAHNRTEHYYADEFNESKKRKTRFVEDMMLIFSNCRTFNSESKKFCKIADEVCVCVCVCVCVLLCASSIYSVQL